jgi:hypothetical protein
MSPESIAAILSSTLLFCLSLLVGVALARPTLGRSDGVAWYNVGYSLEFSWTRILCTISVTGASGRFFCLQTRIAVEP